ncbi:MAG: PEP-CTERM sorting domain-containing protein [Planctomycetes bacterium]|nr:PEP-CTERM sorting domain-containing protein [Planctomycetota bacterium]
MVCRAVAEGEFREGLEGAMKARRDLRLWNGLAFALGIFLLHAAESRAYYWRNWPGTGLQADTTSSTQSSQATVNTSTDTSITVGSLSSDPEVVDPETEIILGDPEIVDPGLDVRNPEPTTILSSLIGLVTLGLLRRWQRVK